MVLSEVVDKLESMKIVTGCTTPEQFVSAFYRFCDAKTCFIPSVDTRPVGSTLAFSLRLADGTPMLRGTCVVKQAWDTAENPFKRPGVQLEITKLTTSSAAIFEQLLSQKTVVTKKTDGVVQAAASETTNQHVPRDKAIDLILRQGNAPAVSKRAVPPPLPGARRDEATVQAIEPQDTNKMAFEEQRTTEVARTIEMPPLYKEESRAPGSAIVLPANPLTDIDDAALDAIFAKCTMGEDAEPIDEDLAIPSLPLPPANRREEIQTLLGVAPLSAIRRDTVKMPMLTDAFSLNVDGAPMPMRAAGTAPLVLRMRRPATVHAIDERFWYLCALGAGLLVAAIVLMSAFMFAS